MATGGEPAVRITGWRLHVLSIPLKAPVRWAGHSEDHIDVLLLDLDISNGARGVAEMAVRQKWHGEDIAAVIQALDQRLLPALKPVDLNDQADFEKLLYGEQRSALARSLVDMAREDVLAQIAGQPLHSHMVREFAHQQVLGAGASEFSCTITRAEPELMAREAARLRQNTGADAFKIKTGQGYDIDSAALAAIRAAVGSQAILSADSNSAGPPEITGPMAEMLAGYGVRWFEDPCRLHPDVEFQSLAAVSCLPILVDNACRSQDAAMQFLGLEARGLSVKVMKTGITESLAIARAAGQRHARIAIGICASTSLSAIYSLSLHAGLPSSIQAMPCEDTFFIQLAADLLREPLQFSSAKATLPAAGPLADLLDWKAIDRLGKSITGLH
jgi:L-alanine-DL-glutamate epimerase-like enolase superfamily enzyme